MSNKTKPHFTGDETIADILGIIPDAANVLQINGLSCTSCSISQYETLRGGVLGHGKSEIFFQNLLKEINTLVKDKNISLDKKKPYTPPTITPLAQQKIYELQEEMDMLESGFKVEVIDESVDGLVCFLDFQYEPDTNDRVFVSSGVTLFIPQDSQKKIEHCVIDFVQNQDESGFVVLTPEKMRHDRGCL